MHDGASGWLSWDAILGNIWLQVIEREGENGRDERPWAVHEPIQRVAIPTRLGDNSFEGRATCELSALSVPDAGTIADLGRCTTLSLSLDGSKSTPAFHGLTTLAWNLTQIMNSLSGYFPKVRAASLPSV